MTTTGVAADRLTAMLPEMVSGAPGNGSQAGGEADKNASAVFGDLLAELSVGRSGETVPVPAGGQSDVAATTGTAATVGAAVMLAAQVQAAVSAAMAGATGYAPDNEKSAALPLVGDRLVAGEQVDGEIGFKAQPGETAAKLQTWLSGPFASAALETGARPIAPLDLTVLRAATHFGPVDGSNPIDRLEDAAAGSIKSVATVAIAADGVDAEAPASDEASLPAAGRIETAGAQRPATADSDGRGQQGGRDETRGRFGLEVEGAEEAPVGDTKSATAASGIRSPEASGPAVMPSAVKQIVATLAGAAPVEIARPMRGAVPEPQRGVLKVLEIQLQPESLGSVKVRLQSKGDGLELHLEAASAETAEVIRRDREVLASMMRAAGYAADDAQIRVTVADAPAAMSATASDGAGNAGANSAGGQQAGAQSSGERFGGSRERGAQGGRDFDTRQGGEAKDRAQQPGASALGIYL